RGAVADTSSATRKLRRSSSDPATPSVVGSLGSSSRKEQPSAPTVMASRSHSTSTPAGGPRPAPSRPAPLQGRCRGGPQVPVPPQRLGDLLAGALEQGQREPALALAPPDVVEVDVVDEGEGREAGVGDLLAEPLRHVRAPPRGPP